MRQNMITCDMCGEVMATHEKRYTVTISHVPAFRAADKSVFDLCPKCATRMKLELTRRRDESVRDN